MILPFTPGAVWQQHTEASQQFADDISAALHDVGLSRKQTAAEMGITEPQLSRQLQGQEHLSAWRLMLLPVSFHVALAKRRAQRVGLTVVEDGPMRQLIDAANYAARALHTRRMVKAALPAARKVS